MAFCKFCGKEITWMKEGRKNVPIENDGGQHNCEKFENSRKSIKKMDRGGLSPEELAKYEQSINTPTIREKNKERRDKKYKKKED